VSRRQRRLGRPAKLTPEIQDAICKQLEIGIPQKYAARANGIDESTFHEWMKKGAAGIEPFAAFREAVERSSARAIGNLHARALAGGSGSSAATWLLDRRYPKEYGSQVLLGGVADAAPIHIKQERETANAILADPATVKKLHEVIATAVAAESNPKKKSTKKR
jgi:transposase